MASASQLPLFHVVGFSGHRQIADPDGAARAIAAALAALRAEAPGEWIALSSIAQGGDRIFVEQARGLGLSWHAILPLPRAEFAKDFAAQDWAAAEALLAQAEHVRVISENGTREDAYLDCGVETVNGADVLIAIWDGEPARGKGGTADVIEYAASLGKATIVIDAVTLEARRRSFGGIDWADRALAHLNGLPEAPAGPGANPFQAPDAIFAFQRKCDAAASRGAPQFRRLIASTVLLHVLATLVAAAALAFALQSVLLPWLKFLCLAAALGVAVVLRRRHHSHHSWVRCRLAAEVCRSALATWGLPRAAPFFEDLQLPGIHGLARSLHVLHSRAAARRPVPLEEFRRIYREQRIDDQIAYYRRQEGRALPQFGRLKLGFWIATLCALASTLVYALAHTAGAEVPPLVRSTVFYFFPIALPAVAAAFISVISINDLQRRVARYREMRLILEDGRRRLDYCRTWNSLERIVLASERGLLREVLEWHSVASFAESH